MAIIKSFAVVTLLFVIYFFSQPESKNSDFPINLINFYDEKNYVFFAGWFLIILFSEIFKKPGKRKSEKSEKVPETSRRPKKVDLKEQFLKGIDD
ncbi:MAG: hypothetical protein PHS92_00065 [Candidatus Gracilibacteria bacterium]|nr:hypothetical protein [Candidatus Gracilibacteria bacterium]